MLYSLCPRLPALPPRHGSFTGSPNLGRGAFYTASSGQSHLPLCIGHQALAEGGHLRFDLWHHPPVRSVPPYDLPSALSVLRQGHAFKLRLHFAESDHDTAGKRLQNISLNGKPILADFDNFIEADSRNKTVVKEFAGPQPDTHGSLVIAFAPAPGSPNQNATSSGIEIITEAAQEPRHETQ